MTGQTDGATSAVDDMKERIAEILSSIERPETPISYYHELDDTLYSVTSTTFIGKYHSQDLQNFIGHISNFRIIQGRALYTGAFTPPTSKLEKTSDTVLLTCNSASDVLNEETGKPLLNENPNYPQADQPGPTASRFTFPKIFTRPLQASQASPRPSSSASSCSGLKA